MTRFSLVPASYLYLLRDAGSAGTEVLLQLRQNTGYMDGHWAAGAAGHVECGESAIDAVRREAHEELGIDVPDPTYEFVMQRTQNDGGSDDWDPVEERVDFIFSARTWHGEPAVREPDKVADLRWFPLTGPPADVVPHERLALSRIGTDAGYLTVGF